MTPLSGTFQPCGRVVLVEGVLEKKKKQANRGIDQKGNQERKEDSECKKGKTNIRKHE